MTEHDNAGMSVSMTERNIRVAIVAANASARASGEAMLPLQYFRWLRRRGTDAYLVVHSRTRDELAATFPDDRERIFAVPDTWVHQQLSHIGAWLPDRIEMITTGWIVQLSTEAAQRRIIRRLVRERAVNLVHQPVPVSPRMPSFLYSLGVPVIIGPMNGGMTYPSGFKYLESPLERNFIAFGRWGSGFINWLLPGKRKAVLLLVANERTRRALPPGICENVKELVENGVDLDLWGQANGISPERKGQLRLAFVGRLIPWKGVDMLLEAIASLANQIPTQLDIIGRGPERERLEQLVQKLDLQNNVVFHGFVEQERSRDLLAQCDALVLPSVYECGGAVVLEAMAAGKPVIATRWGGPADYLDPATGILIEPKDREAMIAQLVDAIQQLNATPERFKEMGLAARTKVEQCFSWSSKIEHIIPLYESCIANAEKRVRRER
jgi:glycosyltransferase involved in cell wall biosynthesis